MDYQKAATYLSIVAYSLVGLSVIVSLTAVFLSQRAARQADAKIEELRKQNLELERQIAPRTLTTGQISAIVAALRPLGRQSVSIVMIDDAESARFAMKIDNAINSAGWDTSFVPVRDAGLVGPTPSGLSLWTPDANRPSAKALRTSFQDKAGLLLAFGVDPKLKTEMMIVGFKPN